MLHRALFGALALITLIQALYLLRAPVVAPLLRSVIARTVAAAIGGEASLGDLAGNWCTQFVVRDFACRSNGVLREIRGANLDLRLAPLRLLRGDLGGARRVGVRAAFVHLDLDAPGDATAAASDAPAPAMPDLAALLDLLPEGATIDVDDLRLDGHGTTRRGRARVRLRPAPRRAHERTLLIDGPDVEVVATVRADGSVTASLAVADTAGIPRLFTAASPLQGGVTAGTVELRLPPNFGIDADLRVAGLQVRDRAVRALAVNGHVDAFGLTRVDLELRAPGATVRGFALSLAYADPLASLRGDLAVDIVDLAPYADLLPTALREQLPLNGSLRAHAGDGRLAVGAGRIVCRSGDVRIAGGALTLTGSERLVGDQPLRLHAALTDATALPLPATLPLRPQSGDCDVLVSMRDGVPTLDATLAIAVADASGRTGRLTGSFGASFGAPLQLRPALRLDGDVLRGAAARLTLGGDLALADARLDVAALRVGLDDRSDALTLRGRIDLAEPANMLANGDLRLECRDVPFAVARPFVPPDLLWPALDGRIGASLQIADGTVSIDGDIAATGIPGLPPASAATATLKGVFERGALRLDALDVNALPVQLHAKGSVQGLGTDQLLGGALDAAAVVPALQLSLDGKALERLDLATIADVALRGDASAELSLAGTLRNPRLDGTIALDRVAVAAHGAPVCEDVTGTLTLKDRALHCEQLSLRAFGRTLALAGDLAHADDRVRIAELRLADGDGTLTVRGDLPLPRTGDGLRALTAATLHLQAQSLPLDPWLLLAGVGDNVAAARLDADVDLQPGAMLRATVDAIAANVAGAASTLPAHLHVELTGDGERTAVPALRIEVGTLHAEGRGQLAIAPAAALADLAALRDAPLELDLAVPTTDLAGVPAAALGMAQLAGALTTEVHVRGTLAAPMPSARLELAAGTLVTAGGQRLDDVAARIDVSPTAIAIRELRAARGRGPIRGDGSFTTAGPLWRDWRQGELTFALHGEDVLLHRRAGVRLRADVDLQLQGRVDDVAVTGNVALRDGKFVARVPLFDLTRRGGRAATTGITIPGLDLGPGIGAHLDVAIATKEPFEVANNVLNGKLDVALRLQGSLAQPVLAGTVSGPDAQLILPGMRLRASTLLVEWKREDPRFPVLTVTARGRRHGYDVQAVVRGRYDKPQVLLSSDPPLPADDLVVLVTTGARPEALRSTSGVGTVLGAYVAQELADWIFGSESTEAKESFLDRFTIETGTEMSQAGTESVVVEFRVLDSVYLQGERDVYEDLNMGVVYRLRFH